MRKRFIVFKALHSGHGGVRRVVFEPGGTYFVGEMGDFEIGEFCFEAVSVGAGGKHADFHGVIRFDPCVAHHSPVLIVKRVVDFDGVKASYRFYPDKFYGAVERYHAPVRGRMRHHCAEIILTVNELNTGLYIILMVESYHHSGLIESYLVLACDFHFGLKLAAIFGIIKGGVIYGETIVAYPPVVTLGSDIHFEGVT